MARNPKAKWRPIEENSTQPTIKATQLIFHSAVSGAESLFDWWNEKGVTVEAHFYVQEHGGLEQYLDTSRQADANFRANRRAISVESWDNRNPDKIPWNPEQLQALAELAVWAHIVHGIPLRRCRNSTDPGIGGHTDFGDWSNVPGKTCPGKARKGQIDTIIREAIKMLAEITGNNNHEGQFVMDTTTKNEMRALIREELTTVIGERRPDKVDTDPTHSSLSDLITQQERDQATLRDELGKLKADTTERLERIEMLLTSLNEASVHAAPAPDTV